VVLRDRDLRDRAGKYLELKIRLLDCCLDLLSVQQLPVLQLS
jgi:hypothetical protein